MFGKSKSFAALFAVGFTLSSCGGVQEGSVFDPVFWENSAFSKKSESTAATDRGLAELVKGNFLPAEALFDQALAADPHNIYALLGKAMIYQNTGQVTRARSLYEAVLAQRPDENQSVLVWTDSTPRNISEVASTNLSLIDSGEVVSNLTIGAAGVDRPAQLGGKPGNGFNNVTPLASSNKTTAFRQTDTDAATGSIPEAGFDESTRNIVSRFETLRDLLDQGLITPEEYRERRNRNIGALIPLTSKPPAAGLDRPVPSSSQISGRLRAIGRALELRSISIEQHASERNIILDALMPAAPAISEHQAIPPQGLLAAADQVRRLEGLREDGMISSDEYSRERSAIEHALQSEPLGRGDVMNKEGVMIDKGDVMLSKEGGADKGDVMIDKGEKEVMAKKTGPQPAIHLASYKSERDADRGWTQLKRAHRDLLGDLQSEVVEVNLGPGKGVFYRLLAGPLADKSVASDLCAQLKSKRQFCEPGFMGTNG